MNTTIDPKAEVKVFRIPMWLGLCLFLAIGLFVLLGEHRARALGALPYVLLLLCPIIHMFMHHGHGLQGGEHPHRQDHPGHGPGERGAS